MEGVWYKEWIWRCSISQIMWPQHVGPLEGTYFIKSKTAFISPLIWLRVAFFISSCALFLMNTWSIYNYTVFIFQNFVKSIYWRMEESKTTANEKDTQNCKRTGVGFFKNWHIKNYVLILLVRVRTKKKTEQKDYDNVCSCANKYNNCL